MDVNTFGFGYIWNNDKRKNVLNDLKHFKFKKIFNSRQNLYTEFNNCDDFVKTLELMQIDSQFNCKLLIPSLCFNYLQKCQNVTKSKLSIVICGFVTLVALQSDIIDKLPLCVASFFQCKPTLTNLDITFLQTILSNQEFKNVLLLLQYVTFGRKCMKIDNLGKSLYSLLGVFDKYFVTNVFCLQIINQIYEDYHLNENWTINNNCVSLLSKIELINNINVNPCHIVTSNHNCSHSSRKLVSLSGSQIERHNFLENVFFPLLNRLNLQSSIVSKYSLVDCDEMVNIDYSYLELKSLVYNYLHCDYCKRKLHIGDNKNGKDDYDYNYELELQSSAYVTEAFELVTLNSFKTLANISYTNPAICYILDSFISNQELYIETKMTNIIESIPSNHIIIIDKNINDDVMCAKLHDSVGGYQTHVHISLAGNITNDIHMSQLKLPTWIVPIVTNNNNNNNNDDDMSMNVLKNIIVAMSMAKPQIDIVPTILTPLSSVRSIDRNMPIIIYNSIDSFAKLGFDISLLDQGISCIEYKYSTPEFQECQDFKTMYWLSSADNTRQRLLFMCKQFVHVFNSKVIVNLKGSYSKVSKQLFSNTSNERCVIESLSNNITTGQIVCIRDIFLLSSIGKYCLKRNKLWKDSGMSDNCPIYYLWKKSNGFNANCKFLLVLNDELFPFDLSTDSLSFVNCLFSLSGVKPSRVIGSNTFKYNKSMSFLFDRILSPLLSVWKHDLSSIHFQFNHEKCFEVTGIQVDNFSKFVPFYHDKICNVIDFIPVYLRMPISNVLSSSLSGIKMHVDKTRFIFP
jgi:hypothetical protein